MKYCTKFDEQIYAIANVDELGIMVTKATYLHNTKVVSLKMSEDKYCQKHKG